jgi:putative ABC transport system substrate-binding protein
VSGQLANGLGWRVQQRCKLAQQRVEALLVHADVLFNTLPEQLVALAAGHRLPVMYQLREFACRMSYGTSIADAFRLMGVYAGRILRGENPADLPVQQSVKIELVINLKIAKTLGLEIPPKLLASAALALRRYVP